MIQSSLVPAIQPNEVTYILFWAFILDTISDPKGRTLSTRSLRDESLHKLQDGWEVVQIRYERRVSPLNSLKNVQITTTFPKRCDTIPLGRIVGLPTPKLAEFLVAHDREFLAFPSLSIWAHLKKLHVNWRELERRKILRWTGSHFGLWSSEWKSTARKHVLLEWTSSRMWFGLSMSSSKVSHWSRRPRTDLRVFDGILTYWNLIQRTWRTLNIAHLRILFLGQVQDVFYAPVSFQGCTG